MFKKRNLVLMLIITVQQPLWCMQGSTKARQQAEYYHAARSQQQHAQDTTRLTQDREDAAIDIPGEGIRSDGCCSVTVDLRTRSGQIYAQTLIVCGFLVALAFAGGFYGGMLLGTFSPKN